MLHRSSPGQREVRFKVEAFALNRADILYITGEHYTELKLPSRVGSEAAGIVDAVGPGSSPKVGDRVSSVPFFTTQSDLPLMFRGSSPSSQPSDYLAPPPSVEGYSATEACSVWMQYLTAYFALKTVGGLSRHMNVLITAAASSAGVGAIQMAKALGATAIATTRSSDKEAFLKKVGADHVIITRLGTDFAPEIRKLTDGRGVDVVFDPVSADAHQGLHERAQLGRAGYHLRHAQRAGHQYPDPAVDPLQGLGAPLFDVQPREIPGGVEGVGSASSWSRSRPAGSGP